MDRTILSTLPILPADYAQVKVTMVGAAGKLDK